MTELALSIVAGIVAALLTLATAFGAVLYLLAKLMERVAHPVSHPPVNVPELRERFPAPYEVRGELYVEASAAAAAADGGRGTPGQNDASGSAQDASSAVPPGETRRRTPCVLCVYWRNWRTRKARRPSI